MELMPRWRVAIIGGKAQRFAADRRSKAKRIVKKGERDRGDQSELTDGFADR
jgi:hypothetical protein